MLYDGDMAKKKPTKYIGFRVPMEYYERLAKVLERINANQYAGMTDVMREVLQIMPKKVLTQEYRDYISGAIDSLPEGDNGSGGGGLLDRARPGKVLGRRKPHDRTA